jgi:hypothetical protein
MQGDSMLAGASNFAAQENPPAPCQTTKPGYSVDFPHDRARVFGLSKCNQLPPQAPVELLSITECSIRACRLRALVSFCERRTPKPAEES